MRNDVSFLNTIVKAMGDTHWELPLVWPTHWNHHPLPIKWYDESDDHVFTISCELPHFKKEEVAVIIQDMDLEISAEREPNENFSEGRKLRIRLSSDLNLDSVSAIMNDGLLRIRIPRMKKMPPNRIHIQIQ